jgi:hypothetical protein
LANRSVNEIAEGEPIDRGARHELVIFAQSAASAQTIGILHTQERAATVGCATLKIITGRL